MDDDHQGESGGLEFTKVELGQAVVRMEDENMVRRLPR